MVKVPALALGTRMSKAQQVGAPARECAHDSKVVVSTSGNNLNNEIMSLLCKISVGFVDELHRLLILVQSHPP